MNHNEFDKRFNQIQNRVDFTFKAFPYIFAVMGVLSLGLVGFGVWVAYRLVTHFAP